MSNSNLHTCDKAAPGWQRTSSADCKECERLETFRSTFSQGLPVRTFGQQIEVEQPPNQVIDRGQGVPYLSMETAPRDGTEILVYFGGTARYQGWKSVKWTSPQGMEGYPIWCVDDHKFGPYALRGYIETDVKGWLPLPSPPAKEKNVAA